MKYEEYYGFIENPFGLTPDPRFHFSSTTHASAFELIDYAIHQRASVMTLTGATGTGKTTLCRAVPERIGRAVLPAVVLNPVASGDEIMRVLLQQFGVLSREHAARGRLGSVTTDALLDTFRAFLRSLCSIGAQALIVIDDAHNLSLQALEQIRALSTLTPHNKSLLQVLLVGHPHLRETLRKPEMRPFDHSIALRHELRPLSRQEISGYVTHRLAIAGGTGSVSFSAGALARVHGCTRGVPRLVNVLCDRALLAACEDRATRVLSGHVDGAAEALDLARPGRLLLAWAR